MRRGSSTDEAEPTESAAMVAADAGRGAMKVDLSVLTPDNGQLPDTVALRFLRVEGTLPDYEKQLAGMFEIASIHRANRHFWREAAEYGQVRLALVELQLVLGNRSDSSLTN